MFETYIETYFSVIREKWYTYEQMRCLYDTLTFVALDIDIPYYDNIKHIHNIGNKIQEDLQTGEPSYYLTKKGCHIIYPHCIPRSEYNLLIDKLIDYSIYKEMYDGICLGHLGYAKNDMIIRVGRKYNHSDIVKAYSGDNGEVIEAHDRFIEQFHTI